MATDIAICFFGITRSLTHTIDSIRRNVLDPARALGSVRVYGHFFDQATVDNPRSGEAGEMVAGEHDLLGADWLELEPPGQCLAKWDFDALKVHGDIWEDDFRSLRNLVHQLHSMHRVATAALDDGARRVAFVRPDLRYHDSLGPAYRAALRPGRDRVYLPYWQPMWGRNDRFAICSGERAVRAYGLRIRLMQAFCAAHGPVHSESLVAYALAEAAIPYSTIPMRAGRVRIGNVEVDEEFVHPRIRDFRKSTGLNLDPLHRAAKYAALRLF